MTRSLLEVVDLHVHFEQNGKSLFDKKQLIRSVDGISLNIMPGESVGLVGESGCGKSTTARAITGLVKKTSGMIRFEGEDRLELKKMNKAELKKIQMVFQDPYSSLNPRMTIASILSEPIKNFSICKGKDQIARKCIELMNLVGLHPEHMYRYPHEFSGGQRQRIGIARALASEPRLLICDEPVSALDVSIQAQILNLLKDLKDQLGLSLLFISHDLSVVRHICDKIYVMTKGKIVESGATDEVIQKPLHEYTKNLLEAIPLIEN